MSKALRGMCLFMDTRNFQMAMGAVRTGLGASLVVAPTWAARVWIGHGAKDHGTKVFARMLGTRDIALGSAILMSSDDDSERTANLVKLGAVMDLADMAATVLSFRNFEGRRKWFMPLLAITVGAAGAAMAFGDDGTGTAGDKSRSAPTRVGQDTATGTDPDARYEKPGYEDKSFGQAVNQDQELAERLDREFEPEEAERRFTEESTGAPVLAEQDKSNTGT